LFDARSDFEIADDFRGFEARSGADDLENARVEINLRPAEGDDFADSRACQKCHLENLSDDDAAAKIYISFVFAAWRQKMRENFHHFVLRDEAFAAGLFDFRARDFWSWITGEFGEIDLRRVDRGAEAGDSRLIEGEAYLYKDQIEFFESADRICFRWSKNKQSWYFAAVPSSNKTGKVYSFEEIESIYGREEITNRTRRDKLAA